MEVGHEIFRALGMTLIHSLWQGAILSVIVLFFLSIVGKSNARLRYLILFSALCILLAAFIATFFLVYRNNQVLEIWQDAIAFMQTGERISQIVPVTPASLSERVFTWLEPFYPALALGWLAGFLFMSLRMTGGAILSRLKFRNGLKLPDAGLSDLFQSVRHDMGLIKARLYISYSRISPFVTGIIRPMVIIPAAAISGLSTDQVRAIMVHELAHIRRLDHLFIIIQVVARQVLFFHPVAWFLIPEIDRERENCCDDFVIRINNSPINYIKALAMIQEMNLQGTPANALTGKSNQLLNRIKRLIKPEMKHTAAFRIGILLLLVATISISAMALINHDQPNVKSTGAVMFDEQDPGSDIQGTMSIHDKDGDKKKMKIIFDGDTIKEMTVNGKKLSKEEMKEYAEEIRKMQQELESSQMELQKAQEELKEAQMELEDARREMEHQEFSQMNQLQEELSQLQFKQDFNKKWESEEFGEEMRKAREDVRRAMEEARMRHRELWDEKKFGEEMQKARQDAMKAFEQARIAQKEYWDKHGDEFREEMKKAGEDARKAFEEFRKHPGLDRDFEFYFNYPGPQVPPVPPSDQVPNAPHSEQFPNVPHVEPLPPVPPGDVEIDVPADAVPSVPDAELDPELPDVPETDMDVIAEPEDDARPAGNSIETLKNLEDSTAE